MQAGSKIKYVTKLENLQLGRYLIEHSVLTYFFWHFSHKDEPFLSFLDTKLFQGK